jgi:hypothetical protein
LVLQKGNKRKAVMVKLSTFWVLGLIILSGCSNCLVQSSRGTEVDTDDLEEVVIGKTTKAEVIGLFGVPDQVISPNSSDIDIHESTQRDRSRFDKDRGSVSGGVHKKDWDVGASSGASHGTHSGLSHNKSTSISTPASAIASQGDIFVYRRITDETWNLKVATFESSNAETLTVVFDEMNVVISYSYKD